ncbi:MAG: 1-acyl-sn-glycerol-3-phosphate acyltransferase [Bacteroidaceae bacterium]|nr:1-acyl-sn-glycerol-3-phosphate acyltransferase [Bacteroidaceae bacterium]
MQLINLEAAIAGKAPHLRKNIPTWLIRMAERIVCQEEMNDILTRLGHNKGAAFAKAMSEDMHVTYTVHGMENLKRDGHYMLVSNHPLGAFDGISYIGVFGSFFPHIKVIVNDLLMYIDPLRSVFLPVNTMGRQKREDMAELQKAYNDPETQLISFPAGFCSRYIGGKVQDIEWKKSVIKQSVEAGRDIVPIYFDGRNSIAFYALEWLRRKLGIKFNIGLILLPRQMIKTARGKHFGIYIGKPIPYRHFDKSRTDEEWAQWLREECYRLRP